MDTRTVEANGIAPDFLASEASMLPTVVMNMTLIFSKTSILYHYDSASPNTLAQTIFALDPTGAFTNSALKQKLSQTFIKIPLVYGEKAYNDPMIVMELLSTLSFHEHMEFKNKTSN